ncbi:uncharacterized protein LOC111697341 isoform X2 [Eurytemora carolleeae]|uniref:uncharacterized protein LOC111697341 isoform X2 n=1 Tax=Eurytemora carolleeae TaxID=1294199 RepID=UPI000C774E7C|nr:uncharacterized protein LOC111697341 isoform X2 [Eurytemora carolleeae]|eukprot:XP_023323078.1 uncharacterized protein LOC111697341 isoform X2 [Eurytemora affinis]
MDGEVEGDGGGEGAGDVHNVKGGVCLLDLPEEIIIKIFHSLNPFDIWSTARVCKYLATAATCESLWKHEWNRVIEETPFQFPTTQTLQDLGVCFQDACKRLCSIIWNGGTHFPKCIHCKEYTCDSSCTVQRANKIVLDIGGKITWIIAADFSLKKHLSMIAVPKLLKCFDCDATIDRGERSCDCRDDDSLKWNLPSCRYRSVSSHTGLQYTSQQLRGLGYQQQQDRPLCLFCEEGRMSRLLCEKDMVLRTKDKLSAFGQPYSLDDTFKPTQSHLFLSNGYCQEAATFLGAENIDLLSPLIALEHNEAFPLVKAYINHLVETFKMMDDLQRPNSYLVLTEPSNISSHVKHKLIRYLFEELQISRLCLLPKPLAISILFECDTCVVIDSGATNTSVWVVLRSRVDPARTRSIGVGGWNVSEYLKQAMSWQETTESGTATVSSLDTTNVKEKCRLSLNLCREEQRNAYRTETLSIRSQGRGLRGGGAHHHIPAACSRGEFSEITLTSELYMAPEMMYASLDLPNMVVEATRDLPQKFIKDCFSNILITGGNSDLQGFLPRLSSDLRERIPEHSALINVSTFPAGP